MDYIGSNEIKLPVNQKPWIQCYRIHAYMLNIIGLKYPTFYDYVISNYLCLHNGKDNIRREYLDFHLDNNFINIRDLFRDNSWFDVVQVYDFDSDHYVGKDEVKNLIISFLQKGYYVLHNVNEGFLRHSSMYGVISNNIALTYGYNSETDTFQILDYNSRGAFGASMVSCEDYLKALSGVTVTNRINFIKAKDNLEFHFEEKKALKLLRCHIKSESAYPDHKDYINNIVGYLGVERTLKESLTNGINLIRIRVLQEHKDMIARYFKYIYDNKYIDTDIYYTEYMPIARNMHAIFMKLIKKSLLNDQNCRQEIDAIRRLNENEAELLERYLNEFAMF